MGSFAAMDDDRRMGAEPGYSRIAAGSGATGPNQPTAELTNRPATCAKKKQEEENRAQAAAEQARKMTVEAAQATMRVGEEAMVHARDWEASWLTGVFVPKGGAITPLTLEQRRELYLQQTLTTPGAYHEAHVCGRDRPGTRRAFSVG